ncbi:hypothetical protein DALLNEIH_01001 [Bacillus sp. B01(2024)]
MIAPIFRSECCEIVLVKAVKKYYERTSYLASSVSKRRWKDWKSCSFFHFTVPLYPDSTIKGLFHLFQKRQHFRFSFWSDTPSADKPYIRFTVTVFRPQQPSLPLLAAPIFRSRLLRPKPNKESREIRVINCGVRFITSNFFGHILVKDQKYCSFNLMTKTKKSPDTNSAKGLRD